MSQLIDRLKGELSTTSDPAVRAVLLAKIACAQARTGELPEAREVVKQLRSEHGDWRSGRIHVWLMLAEGLISWQESLSPNALDRITRAQVLSIAMRYSQMAAISSAWKAHIEFDMSNFDGMFRSLRLALANAGDEDADAHVRIAIVLSNTAAICREWELSKECFQRGRRFAIAEGDRASIEALQYNRAAFELANLRVDYFGGESAGDSIQLVRRELNSSLNLLALTGIDSLSNQQRLCEARMQVLEENYASAVPLLRSTQNETPFASYNFSSSAIELEIAYCQFRLGQLEDALSTFAAVDIGSFSDLDIDDQFVLISMLREMALADARFGDVAAIDRHRDELRDTYRNSRQALKAGLDRFRTEHPEAFSS